MGDAMSVSTAKMTAQQFLLMGEDPPGLRLELTNGEIEVSPSPTPDHQEVVLALGSILREHVLNNRLGRVFLEVDTVLGGRDVRRPDLFYFSNSRLHLVGKKQVQGPPDLMVEVISRVSRKTDRKQKYELYRDSGVAHYWIVDPLIKTIEGYRLVAGQYEPSGTGAGQDTVHLPPFETLGISLEAIWPQSD